ncbi:MAG TPA: DMT family transporter [Nocardioides sp.]|uniref:DMT family transporter n=1 Tax=Nocardioides sp. TaxID=35761 RepID=UPI002F40C430
MPLSERPWLPLAAVATTLLLWASAFVAIRHLGADFSAGALSLGRLLVGSVALGAVAVPRGLPRPSGRDWLGLVAIGVLWFGVYNVALNQGEHHVDAGTSAMLIQISPVLIAVLATLFLGERFTPWLAIGLVLAFAGVVLIGLSQPGGRNDLVGVLLCLLAALVYSIALVIQKPLVSRLSAIHVTWLACTVGAVACLPFAGQLVDATRHASASDIWWVVYLGLFPTAIAFTTYAFALRHMTASNLGITTYLVPPITILMGWVFLGETPPGMAYAGGALALVGVAIARRKTRTPAAQTSGEAGPVPAPEMEPCSPLTGPAEAEPR